MLKGFFKTLKNKIYKFMASVSKNVCIDKLDDAVNKSSIYIYYSKEINNKDPKF